MMQRIKFYLKPLVNEILDQLPPEVFQSDSTTFLDPALGGGQFLREVIKRLRAAGHSDDNIRSRIWGCEIRELRLKYAVRFGGVISDHLITTDFISYDWGNMKFDVILGNPPYQDNKPSGERKSLSTNLWTKFIDRCSHDLLKSNGYLAMVVPASWAAPTKNLSGGRKILSDIFAVKNTIHINIDPGIAKYFEGVGSTFSWFILQNKEYQGNTQLKLNYQNTLNVDLREYQSLPRINNPLAFSINKKYFARIQGDVISGQYRTHEGQYQAKKTKSFKHAAYHTPADGGRIWYMDKKHPNHDKPKVIISLSGKYQPVADTGTMGYTDMCLAYILKPGESLDSVMSVLNSKLYHFIMESNKWSGFNNKQVIRTFVFPELNQVYTDDQIYDQFDLTPEEKTFVNSYKEGT